MQEHDVDAMRNIKNKLDKVLESEPNDVSNYKHPDPLKHKYISFAKSGLRILAGVALATSMFWYAGGLLILAEILGIVEEMV
jgi:hypothetical protein